MKVNSFYPVILTEKVEVSAKFYMKWLGFEETFSSDWYYSLIDSHGNELAVMAYDHVTIPEGLRRPVSGLILNFEVDDVDSIYETLKVKEEINIIQEIRSEDFGQRHFIIEGPSKVMIDIIEIIPVSEEFEENYV